MAGFTQYAEKKILDLIFSDTPWTIPSTWYLGLFTVAPTDSGGGTEVSGGSYARLAVTNNTTNFPAASGGSPSLKANGAAFTFATPTADWGTVVAVGVFDASTAGNLIGWALLVVPKTILNGASPASWAIGEWAVNLD